MKKFLFVDLDDTLFQTPAKCKPADALVPAAYYADGSVCSFTTAAQRALLEGFQAQMTLIPTTARSHAALERVALPFSSYAITNFGGLILQPNGARDEHWHSQMGEALTPMAAELLGVKARIDEFQQQQGWPGRARLMAEAGLTFYVNIKDPEKNTARLDMLQQQVVEPWLADHASGFYLHRNGNNLAVLPPVLNKARAVVYLCTTLRAQYGEILTFGLGDSHSDAQFMTACDYAIIPKGSQLAGLALGTL